MEQTCAADVDRGRARRRRRIVESTADPNPVAIP
jgi:hypothetical protein